MILGRIYRDSVVVTSACILGSLLLIGDFEALSIAAGSVLALGNLMLISFLVKGFISFSNKMLAVLLWVGKLVILAFLIWASFFYLKLNPVALLVGLTIPVFAIIYEGLRSVKGGIKDG